MVKTPRPADYRKVDPKIADVIEWVNALPYARTVFSCAGYGYSPARKGPHAANACAEAYVVVEYDTKHPGWRDLHSELSVAAGEVRRVRSSRFVYYVGTESLAVTKRRWAKVRAVVKAVSQWEDKLHAPVAKR